MSIFEKVSYIDIHAYIIDKQQLIMFNDVPRILKFSDLTQNDSDL